MEREREREVFEGSRPGGADAWKLMITIMICLMITVMIMMSVISTVALITVNSYS